MEKMLPHLGYVQPTFHVLSQLARPVPLSLGQQMPTLPTLPPFATHGALKLAGLPPATHDSPHSLSYSVLGRGGGGGGGGYLDRAGGDPCGGLPPGLPSPYDRDDDKGEHTATRDPQHPHRCPRQHTLTAALPSGRVSEGTQLTAPRHATHTHCRRGTGASRWCPHTPVYIVPQHR